MYGCESWTAKKAECWKIDAFELGCWRRLLRVPWTARRSNQSILKKISPGFSLEGLMLKLKLEYFGHLMWRVDSLEKTLMLGGIGGRRRRGWQDEMASLTWWTWVWVNSGSWWWTGRPGVLRFTGSQRVGQDWATELNWMSSQDLHEVVHFGQWNDTEFSLHCIKRFVMSICLITGDVNLDHLELQSWEVIPWKQISLFPFKISPISFSIHWWIFSPIMIIVVLNHFIKSYLPFPWSS